MATVDGLLDPHACEGHGRRKRRRAFRGDGSHRARIASQMFQRQHPSCRSRNSGRLEPGLSFTRRESRKSARRPALARASSLSLHLRRHVISGVKKEMELTGPNDRAASVNCCCGEDRNRSLSKRTSQKWSDPSCDSIFYRRVFSITRSSGRTLPRRELIDPGPWESGCVFRISFRRDRSSIYVVFHRAIFDVFVASVRNIRAKDRLLSGGENQLAK